MPTTNIVALRDKAILRTRRSSSWFDSVNSALAVSRSLLRALAVLLASEGFRPGCLEEWFAAFQARSAAEIYVLLDCASEINVASDVGIPVISCADAEIPVAITNRAIQ